MIEYTSTTSAYTESMTITPGPARCRYAWDQSYGFYAYALGRHVEGKPKVWYVGTERPKDE